MVCIVTKLHVREDGPRSMECKDRKPPACVYEWHLNDTEVSISQISHVKKKGAPKRNTSCACTMSTIVDDYCTKNSPPSLSTTQRGIHGNGIDVMYSILDECMTSATFDPPSAGVLLGLATGHKE